MSKIKDVWKSVRNFFATKQTIKMNKTTIRLRIFHQYRYYKCWFVKSEGNFYYTESGQRNYMDVGGLRTNKTIIRRLGKWWEIPYENRM